MAIFSCELYGQANTHTEKRARICARRGAVTRTMCPSQMDGCPALPCPTAHLPNRISRSSSVVTGLSLQMNSMLEGGLASVDTGVEVTGVGQVTGSAYGWGGTLCTCR